MKHLVSVLLLYTFSACQQQETPKVYILVPAYEKIALSDDFEAVAAKITLDSLVYYEDIGWANHRPISGNYPQYSFMSNGEKCTFTFVVCPSFGFNQDRQLITVDLVWGGVDWSGPGTISALNNEVIIKTIDLISKHEIDLKSRFEQFSSNSTLPFVSVKEHAGYFEKLKVTKLGILYQIGLKGYPLREII